MKRFNLYIFAVSSCMSIPSFLSAQMTWTCATPSADWSPRDCHGVVVFHDTMWVIGGWSPTTQFNDVWFSTDGDSWTCKNASASWNPRCAFSLVVFHDTMWLMGGRDELASPPVCWNDVWKSGDGDSWICTTNTAPWMFRSAHSSVVFHDSMWVIGGVWQSGGSWGFLNDVWSSVDGVNWTRACSSAQWSPRCYHSSVVFDDKLWVIGGYDNITPLFNDVWYSADGVNWDSATGSAAWEPRGADASVVFQDMMWLMGGAIDPYLNCVNDVWSSTDGINWTCEDDSADWGRRYHLGGLVFDNKMWVMGGSHTYEIPMNDVWYSYGVGIEESNAKHVARTYLSPTIFRGSLHLPKGKTCRIFDITGREVGLEAMKPGIYFVEVDGKITQKVIKVR